LRQKVSFADIFSVQTKGKFGRIVKEAGFRCRKCRNLTFLDPVLLPPGALQAIPSIVRHDADAIIDAARKAKPADAVEAITEASRGRVQWVKGKNARVVLWASLQEVRAGDALSTVYPADGEAARELPVAADASLDDVLEELDGTGAALLVLRDAETQGNLWQGMFHPELGAAMIEREAVKR